MSALLSIGMFGFSLSTLGFDELQRRTDWRHARSPRIGARDAAQFVGIGDDTISISGTAVAELQEGRASLDELRALADTGEPQVVVDGLGRVYGSFIITSIDERAKSFFPTGEARAIEFGIDLSRVDDPNGL